MRRLLVLVGLVVVTTAVASVVAVPDGPETDEGPDVADRSNVATDLAVDDSSGDCPLGPTESTRERADEIADGTEPRFVELHPNPTTEGNAGEFFVLKVPTETLVGNWTVTDGHTTASLPNETVSGRVAFSLEPETTATKTTHPVVGLEGYLRLAADGDDLELREDGEVVDAVSYDRAPTAETWYRADGEDGVWWPKGATCLPPTTGDAEEATAFVLPDSPEVPLEALARADDRILLAGYTFASRDVADELIAAHERGVEVAVLLEGGPVGGTPETTRSVVDDLHEAGVAVRVIGGEGARYTYHHPKYAVVDDGALVLTENWKPSGVGGAASRGWGVHLEDPSIAGELAEVFAADFTGRDTTTWEHHRERATFVEDEGSRESFQERTAPETVPVENVELLVAPDNAERRLSELLDGAEESIRIKQVRIGEDVSLLEDALEAARRGVEVRILLDATWYVESENRALADDLQRTADEEDLPLEVRLVEPGDRFEKIHAKGVVIDGETAVVGSANWNENAFRANREVLVVLQSEAAGAYYAEVFDDDWDGESWPLPLEFAGLVTLGVVATGIAARRYVEFGDGDNGRNRPPRVVPTIDGPPTRTSRKRHGEDTAWNPRRRRRPLRLRGDL